MSKNLSGSNKPGMEAIAAIAGALNRHFNTDLSSSLALARAAKVRRLPFGIYKLDYALRGGLPIGHITRLWGPKSTLKSTLCLRAMRSAQNTCRHCKSPMVLDKSTGEIDCACPPVRWKLVNREAFGWLSAEDQAKIVNGELPEKAKVSSDGGTATLKLSASQDVSFGGDKVSEATFEEMYRCEPMRVALVDSERSYDHEWARENGVDSEIVLLLPCSYGEQAVDSIVHALSTGELDFLVIDSLSELTPKAELEKSADDSPKMAASAALMKRLAAKLNSLRASQGANSLNHPTILMTSQIAAHLGTGFSWVAPSSNGSKIEHLVSTDIRMSEKKYIMQTENIPAAGIFHFEVTKQKTAVGKGAQGDIKFRLIRSETAPVGDSEDEKEVFNDARSLGLIQETESPKAYSFESKYVAEKVCTFKTIKDLVFFLRDNMTIYMDLRDRVFEKKLEAESMGTPQVAEKGKKGKK